ncbi:hypothetical protein RS85_02250 [Microbacterium sp. SA39]|nr:hypothetical protein RS85_02250 [Microbacterium sp. SA39]
MRFCDRRLWHERHVGHLRHRRSELRRSRLRELRRRRLGRDRERRRGNLSQRMLLRRDARVAGVVRVPVGRTVGQRREGSHPVGIGRPRRRGCHRASSLLLRLLGREERVQQRDERRADRGEDRESDDDAPVQLAVVEAVREGEEEDEHGDEATEEDERRDVDDACERRHVSLRGRREESHVQQGELQDADDQQQLEEALRSREVAVFFRKPDLHRTDEKSDDPGHHAGEGEPVRPVRRESRFEDRDAGEGGQEQDREERAADQTVLIPDEHPDDTDQSGGDQGPDRDPDGPPDEQ